MKKIIPMGQIEEEAIKDLHLHKLICRKDKILVITYEWKITKSNFNDTTSILKCYYLNSEFIKADVIGTNMEK